MPLYEYRCKQCGHQFEKIQSFSAPELTQCPVCPGEIERLLSAPAVQFKGSGWYVTDYAGKGSGAGKSGSGSASKPAESSASTTEASKSAATSTSAPATSAPASSSSKSE